MLLQRCCCFFIVSLQIPFKNAPQSTVVNIKWNVIDVNLYHRVKTQRQAVMNFMYEMLCASFSGCGF